MNKNDFFLKLEEGLELDLKIDESTNLKNLDDWDSMMAMVLIGIVNDEFAIILKPDDIEKISTVASLVERIGIEKFN